MGITIVGGNYVRKKDIIEKALEPNSQLLKKALYEWINDRPAMLEKLYKTNPSIFTSIDYSKPLYRGIVLFEDDYMNFIEKGKKIKSTNLFESWTASRQAAMYFMKLRLDEDWGNYGILLYKHSKNLIMNITDQLQKVGLTDLSKFYSREAEYLALSESHDKKSVIEVIDDDFQRVRFK
jgi:hypothetical protein